MRAVGILVGALCMSVVSPALAQDPVSLRASAGQGLPQPLTDIPGNADRGRALATARDRGNCVACHVIPAPDEATHGNLGPSLKGLADRQNEAQIRARIVDARALNPASAMPSYHRTGGLTRVAKALDGRPVLSAQEVEDMVAFMMTLREGQPAR